MKRAFDLVAVIAAAPLVLAVVAVVALVSLAVQGRPVLFFQERAGKNGKSFRMFKFRTMRPGEESDGERLTKFGRFLRSTSLDELPELWNVLKGEMSLVGPRPLPVRYLPRYSPQQARRHEVTPGITGWAQVNGRNSISWEEKFRLDVEYVDNRSFFFDLKILFLTVAQVFLRRGISHEGSDTMEEFIVKRAVLALVFLGLTASGATYKVDIDRASGLYRCGEKATFTVRLLSADNLDPNGQACVQLDNFGTSVLTNLPFCIASTGVAFTVSGTLDEPGFLRLSLPSTRDGRSDPFVFSVGFEPEKIVKGSPRPCDFDEYWAGERERLEREVPLDAQIVRVPERCTSDFDYYRISFATFGRRVHGYMSIPTDRSKAPFPVDFGVNAAGFGSWTNNMEGDKDSIRVQFSVYPFPPHWKWNENGLVSQYKMMNDELRSKYGASSYNHAGITDSREAYFFHSVLLGIDRAVNWLAARPDVDISHFRYQGTSQGGGFGLYLCGLNRAFTRAVFYVPAIADTMGYLKGRESGWPRIVENNSSLPSRRSAAEKWAPYFDGANFASRIYCPVRIAVGFSDTTCPPCAVYAAYNEIRSTDKGIVHGIGMTHSCSQRFYKELGDWVKAR